MAGWKQDPWCCVVTQCRKRQYSLFVSLSHWPISCSGWEMKMPVFLQAAPGMSLGKEFDAPSKRLELSSAVKVKTHQFLSKSHCVLDLSVCGKRRRREEKDSDGACRIRPLGVTVLSRIRPAHRHTNTRANTANKMVSHWGSHCSRTLGLALSWLHRECLVLRQIPLSRDGWLMAGATTSELFTKSYFSPRRRATSWLPLLLLQLYWFFLIHAHTTDIFIHAEE